MTAVISGSSPPRVVGRYAIYDVIATGGMATVHIGRLVGPVGFTRTVAVKRLHPQYARDPEFVSMFLDEARLAARIQHPNVVPTIDVIAMDGELLLIMEYVRGEALGRLGRAATERKERIPPRIVVGILSGALSGLHSAHEAGDEAERTLGIVHRDVSPQNILVGIDGVARVLDFGVAKAEDRVQVTKDQKLKGKLLYMSPEQLEAGDVDRRTDIYAMAIVLFEALTGTRMFVGERQAAQLMKISRGEIRVPSEVLPELAPFDPIVRKGAALNPTERYSSAREMARALEAIVAPASTTDVGEWVQAIAGDGLRERTKRIAEIESVNRLDLDVVRGALADELERSRSDPSMSRLAPDSSSSASMVRVPERRSNAWVWGLVCALVVVVAAACAAVFIVVHRGSSSAQSAPVVAVSGKTTEADPSQSARLPTSTASPVAPDSSMASAVTTAAPAAPTTRVKTTPTVKRDCEQPYVVDSAGHMHFRKECL